MSAHLPFHVLVADVSPPQSIWVVAFGTIVGHSLCTAAAVVGGRYIATKISAKHGPPSSHSSPFHVLTPSSHPRRSMSLPHFRGRVRLRGPSLFLSIGPRRARPRCWSSAAPRQRRGAIPAAVMVNVCRPPPVLRYPAEDFLHRDLLYIMVSCYQCRFLAYALGPARP
jgi:hypothetical protein